ncbi:MAG TPA: hypothetical protein VLG76_07050 [Rhabdochlamydiaceae bacterium]|nr:hypothetical protein [Rhabdochlamydiaceae bacterium]
MDILIKLNQYKTIEGLNAFFKELAWTHGFTGRKAYAKGLSGAICLNDFVKRFSFVYRSTQRSCDLSLVIKLVETIRCVDHATQGKLGLIQTVFTRILSWCGKHDYDRDKVLTTLHNEARWKIESQKIFSTRRYPKIHKDPPPPPPPPPRIFIPPRLINPKLWILE